MTHSDLSFCTNAGILKTEKCHPLDFSLSFRTHWSVEMWAWHPYRKCISEQSYKERNVGVCESWRSDMSVRKTEKRSWIKSLRGIRCRLFSYLYIYIYSPLLVQVTQLFGQPGAIHSTTWVPGQRKCMSFLYLEGWYVWLSNARCENGADWGPINALR